MKVSAQSGDNAVDSASVSVPKMFINENGNIEWMGFPAYSEDGKTILLVHQVYSCCISGAVELRETIGENLKSMRKVVLVQNEEQRDFTLAQRTKIIDSVNIILNERRYHSLIAIDFFTTKSDPLTSKYSVNFEVNGKSFEIPKFQLSKFMLQGACCNGGLSDNEEQCEMAPGINKIWIIPETKFVLIEYGVLHQMNGCDRGPEYTIVRTVH